MKPEFQLTPGDVYWVDGCAELALFRQTPSKFWSARIDPQLHTSQLFIVAVYLVTELVLTERHLFWRSAP